MMILRVAAAAALLPMSGMQAQGEGTRRDVHVDVPRLVAEATGLDGAEWAAASVGDGTISLSGLSWRRGSLELGAETVEAALDGGGMRLGGLGLKGEAASISASEVTVVRDGGDAPFRTVSSEGMTVSGPYGTWTAPRLEVEAVGWKDGFPSSVKVSASGAGWTFTVEGAFNGRTGAAVVDFSWESEDMGTALARVSLGGVNQSWLRSLGAVLDGTGSEADTRRVVSEANVVGVAAAFRDFGWLGQAYPDTDALGFLSGGVARAVEYEARQVEGVLRSSEDDVKVLYEPSRPLTLWSLLSAESFLVPPNLGRVDQ